MQAVSPDSIFQLVSSIISFIVSIMVGAVAWAVRTHITKMGKVIDIVAVHTTEIAIIQRDIEHISDKEMRIDRSLERMQKQLDEVN